MGEPDSRAADGARFDFGKNWTRFLASLDEARIGAAQDTLRTMLGVETLEGRRFLDVGAGSGLFSLAACRLGAEVHSFDADAGCVACVREVRSRYAGGDPRWAIERGSVLDPDYVTTLGQFDVVYAWGVLHHTGAMRKAMENVAALVSPGGQLFIAIYNDQGWVSDYWRHVKRLYNRNFLWRGVVLAAHLPYLYGLRGLIRALTGRSQMDRGMSLWYDTLDWLGGYPFEVARPEAVFDFFRSRGFSLTALRTCAGRHGCNELVLRRDDAGGAGQQ